VPNFTTQLFKLIRKKNNLKNTLTKRRKNGYVHNDSYNNCSRRYEELCSQLTKLKQQEKRKLNHRRFRRKTWMDINNVLGNHRKPDQPIELLSDDDVLVKEKVRVADTFNEYFTSIGEELAAELGDTLHSGVVQDRNLSSIFLFGTTGTDVRKITDSLHVSRASGYNQVSVKAMKSCKHELILYLVHSINCSMNSGIYLDCLKLAKVTQIRK
jgi:hypothetical protein